MEDIIVNSSIDFKTFYNISVLVVFKLRSILIMGVFVIVVTYYSTQDSLMPLWEKILTGVVIYLFYTGILLLIMLLSAKKRMKVSPFLNGPLLFTINHGKIELKGETISTTTAWQNIVKLIEREKYFLLMLSARGFFYLPKAGFGSEGKIDQFRELVRAKGIKMSYH